MASPSWASTCSEDEEEPLPPIISSPPSPISAIPTGSAWGALASEHETKDAPSYPQPGSATDTSSKPSPPSFAEVLSKGSDLAYCWGVLKWMPPLPSSCKSISVTRSDCHGEILEGDQQILGSDFDWMALGLFHSARKSLARIHEALVKVVGSQAIFQVEGNNSREVLLRFTSKEDFLKVITCNVIEVDGAPMRLFRWLPQLIPGMDSNKVFLWINVSNLPVHLSHPAFLTELVKPWGSYIDRDPLAEYMIRPSHLRLCVEIDIRAKIPRSSIIKSGSVWIRVSINPEHWPRFCTRCGRHGPIASKCQEQRLNPFRKSLGRNRSMDGNNIGKNKKVAFKLPSQAEQINPSPNPPLQAVIPQTLEEVFVKAPSNPASTSGSLVATEQGALNIMADVPATPGGFTLPKAHGCRPSPPPVGRAKSASAKVSDSRLFIDCGGPGREISGIKYESDAHSLGSSVFHESTNKNWAYSSTGDFLVESGIYTVTNTSALKTSNPLYLSARVSASSLKYYGLCLQSGIYTVKLHFAEIIFTDDQTYYSLGRRLFDVTIQGEILLKDFNIAKEANGTGREIVKSFNAIVPNGTLEIGFRWSGKGTNSIPARGNYGPLISAISVTPNFIPKDFSKSKGDGISSGAIAGIVIASLVAIFLIILILCLSKKKNPIPRIPQRKKEQENEELKQLMLEGTYFSLKQIKVATKNFDPENKIGEGGFGPVYKGVLKNGFKVAVKQLSSKSKQGKREFVNEIGIIFSVQHPNLVKLFGCCIEGRQLMLVYEYMENNSLARALSDPESLSVKLDWRKRLKISLDIARGLAYLHEESKLKIVHRDIKATNILLDKHLNAKISDFGLAKLDDEENTHISTRIVGTFGYMAPEYAMSGHLTEKADVYSYGIVLLEILSGRSKKNFGPTDEFAYIVDWARALKDQGKLQDLVDPIMGTNFSVTEAEQMLNLALLCTNASPTLRPTMTSVVSMIEKGTKVAV